MAAYDTWAQDVAPFADVFFMIGECEYPPLMKDMIVCLNTPDVYPPMIKAFKVFKYFHQLPRRYDFIVKIDLDTFVNARELKAVLRQLEPWKPQTKYIGVQGLGIESEREKLGLTKPFCIGFGFILTATALDMISNNTVRCLNDLAYKHDDTEVFMCPFSCAS